MSSLNQEKVNQLVLVIDHGSTDNTFKLLKPLVLGNHISYIRLERLPNEINSASRPLNAGLLHLISSFTPKGWLFVRLDSDDYFCNTKSLYMQINNSNDAKLSFSPLVFVSTDSACLYDLKKKYKNYHSLLAGAAYSIPHHSCIYSLPIVKEMLDTYHYLYDESLNYGEDLDFTIRFLQTIRPTELFFYENPLVFKSIQKDSITNNVSERSFIKNHLYIFKKHKGLNKILLLKSLLHILFQSNNKLWKKAQRYFGYPGLLYGKETNCKV